MTSAGSYHGSHTFRGVSPDPGYGTAEHRLQTSEPVREDSPPYIPSPTPTPEYSYPPWNPPDVSGALHELVWYEEQDNTVPDDGAPGPSHVVARARKVPAKTAGLQGQTPQGSARLIGLETINQEVNEEDKDCEIVCHRPITKVHIRAPVVYSADPISRKDWMYYELEMQRLEGVNPNAEGKIFKILANLPKESALVCQLGFECGISSTEDVSILRHLVIYSGATHHVLYDRALFAASNFRTVQERYVRTGGGEKHPVKGIGKVVLHSYMSGAEYPTAIVLHEAL
jgi:hypothetical protein